MSRMRDLCVRPPLILKQGMTHKNVRAVCKTTKDGEGMFIVGIDVAKRKHDVSVITTEGDVVFKPFSIMNRCSGYNYLMEKLHKLTNIRGEFIFAMESTAHYWLALYTRLKKDGYTVVVLNPVQTSSMREMCLQYNKTDSIDALAIAEVIRFGRYSASNVPQEKLLALKELCRSRNYIIEAASDFKRKIITLLDRIFPEYETIFDSLFCKSSIAVLKKYPTPQKLINAHTNTLTGILRSSSGGHFGEWKARELKEAARNSFGVEDYDGVYSRLIQIYLEQQLSLQTKAEELEKEIATLLKEFETPVTSIPGIGTILAAVVLSEIGDITRFGSADQLASYIGVCPTVKQSGTYTSPGAHMSKHGSPYLRKAVWMAARTAVLYDPMFRSYYERKRGKGKNYMIAMGHVTRKMVSVIYAVMKSNTAYVPHLQAA